MSQQPLTVTDFLTFLAPEIWNDRAGNKCPVWPGDVFAVAAGLLEKSGAYAGVGTQFMCVEAASEELKPDHRHPRLANRVDGDGVMTACSRWESDIRVIAKEWRQLLGLNETTSEVPEEVQKCWDLLCKESHFLMPVGELSSHPELCEAILKLCAICDETFEGVGVLPLSTLLNDPNRSGEVEFWMECFYLLRTGQSSHRPVRNNADSAKDTEKQSTLCREIHPSRIRILPKAQTPRFGLSVRSLTHYVTLSAPSLLKSTWHWHMLASPQKLADHHCNILLFPWPFEVSPNQFSQTKRRSSNSPLSCSRHSNTRWFDYNPRNESHWEPVDTLKEYLDSAEKKAGSVHVVVLPEAALTERQYELVKEMTIERGVILVTGLMADGEGGELKNCASVVFPPVTEKGTLHQYQHTQQKHHRWKLDQDQIVRYGLTGRLNPELEWWENTPINDRTLRVFGVREWLCTCALICEDLARLDPAGRVVRALAPDLVIALLFDGPQLATRWPGYYATVMADDPGSSVLTLTSLGMARLSRSIQSGLENSQDVVGMWRDIENSTIEIRLPKDSKAAVLTVHRKRVPVETADGRTKSVNSLTPVFGGLTFL